MAVDRLNIILCHCCQRFVVVEYMQMIRGMDLHTKFAGAKISNLTTSPQNFVITIKSFYFFMIAYSAVAVLISQ